jgi:Protein of unknown function (DUF1553)/Protein of unknown function (DUF1549)/Planctomycete cytochrome C
MLRKLSFFLLLSLIALQASLALAEDISFSRDIRPILSQNCIFCHGPDDQAREADLRLDREEEAKQDRGDYKVINPGNPEKSLLLQRILSKDPDEVMPPPRLHRELSAQQVELLTEWIRQGAKWGRHWSYEPISRPPVPSNGEQSPIDAFLLKRLSNEKLTFSPEAERAVLIRRLALDITGLPPTLDELDQLATAPYESLVEHFISKPAYGEHWARPWLDLARYADSAGYPSDPGRDIYSYRDWVIRALNDNMPFDQFTTEQLAGDLLENPTSDQLIATAFHRNTMTNNEGGTNDEEFRTAAIIDRVNTTFAVWMGTTMACAQCHTHKYDPITQTEYFQVYAIFNQTADADKRDESPLYEILEEPLRKQREEWKKEIAELEKSLGKSNKEWLDGFKEWLDKKPAVPTPPLKEALALEPEKRTAKQTKSLEEHYIRNVSPATKTERDQLTTLKNRLSSTKPVTIPIMKELDAEKHRKTFVQLRGNWQALGDEVVQGVPTNIHSPPSNSSMNRLGLVEWLMDQENPLVARVAVNRMWEAVFGIGIVRSSEEFGSQGDLPEHPELLDWLSAEFIESKWDVKKFLTLLFTSKAYRQVSTSSPELNERDSDNRWLARGPRFRPSGELLRDQALAVSGLLSTKMYGPPVRPLMPQLGLRTAFGPENDWKPSEGEDAHRRSLYTEVRRNNPYPSFNTFDSPNRETCTIRRNRSNTPLQALVTLNDPVFIETHQAMARRVLESAGSSFEERLTFLFKACLGRNPNTSDLATLEKLYQNANASYQTDLHLASKMSGKTDPKVKNEDLTLLAAWTTIASVVMNLDEFLMRR